jgi:hypothetical protein
MIQIKQIDLKDKAQVNRFIRFHFDLYAKCPQWVPPFITDVKTMLNKEKHPFYEHSDADFFIAEQDGKVVGRIAAIENRSYNKYHDTKQAVFYLYDSIDDQEVSNLLFDRVFDWSKKRGLNRLVGPKGFSAFDGYGICIQGHERRQMMNMMNYNYPYYQRLVEKIGFEKVVDFNSTYIDPTTFKMPERIHEISRRIQEKGTFQVQRFRSKGELKQWASRVGKAYNNTFVNNWEYFPLTEKEIKFLLDNLLVVAVPDLIKIITHKEDVVGFLFAFPDASKAMQRGKGRITPWSIVDLLWQLRTSKWVSLNGVGVLPEYHGRGGNALLYSEIAYTVTSGRFKHAELTQVAESAVQMRQDLDNLGAKQYKNHRVYHRDI